MAIKVIAQLREVKIGKNPGKKFVMRHLGDGRSLYPPAWTWHHALRGSLEGCRETGGCKG